MVAGGTPVGQKCLLDGVIQTGGGEINREMPLILSHCCFSIYSNPERKHGAAHRLTGGSGGSGERASDQWCQRQCTEPGTHFRLHKPLYAHTHTHIIIELDHLAFLQGSSRTLLICFYFR